MRHRHAGLRHAGLPAQLSPNVGLRAAGRICLSGRTLTGCLQVVGAKPRTSRNALALLLKFARSCVKLGLAPSLLLPARRRGAASACPAGADTAGAVKIER